MKCTAKLVYYKKLTKTGKRKLFSSLPYNWSLMSWWDSLPTKNQDKLDFGSIVECGGKIIAEIGCHAEPTYGEEYDSYPEMDINFICEDCKQYYHPNLPREVTALNEWLTDIVESLDTPDTLIQN